MNTLEFAKDIPAEQIAEIFRNYFEQHMMVYDMLRGVQFVNINKVETDPNRASIIYSIKLLDSRDKENLERKLRLSSGSLNIYGQTYTPQIYMNGDLLCISIKK